MYKLLLKQQLKKEKIGHKGAGVGGRAKGGLMRKSK